MKTLDKHKVEAHLVGLEFIGNCPTESLNYKQYRCKNGHTISLQPQHVRRNTFTCKFCYEDGIKTIANSAGYEVLGASELGSYFRLYKKPCGCIENIRVASVAKTAKRTQKTNVCKTCYDYKLKDNATLLGIDILENIDAYTVKVMFKSCGHIKDVKKVQIGRKNIVCRECKELSFSEEAAKEGLILHFGTSNNDSYRTYTLPCGCVKKLRPSHVRESRWRCTVCDDSHYNKPSVVYLLKLNLDNGESVLKLGYARDIVSRVYGYGFRGTYETLACVDFDTGEEAFAFERTLHKKLRKHRIDKNFMYKFMNNGVTECYSVELQGVILEELSNSHSRRRDG